MRNTRSARFTAAGAVWSADVTYIRLARAFGKPDVFNSDQGSQFRSAAFTGALKRKGVIISMDGRGRALDNIFVERPHQSLGYRTPDEVDRSAEPLQKWMWLTRCMS